MQQWNKSSFVLIGYSFGACVAPFIAEYFPVELKEQLNAVYCLSPDETGDFEIHITDMLDYKTSEKYNVLEEMKKIKLLNPVCIFGEEEDSDLRNHFTAAGVKVETLPGSHHYDNDFAAVAGIVIKDLSPGK